MNNPRSEGQIENAAKVYQAGHHGCNALAISTARPRSALSLSWASILFSLGDSAQASRVN